MAKTGPHAEQWKRHHDDMVSIANRLDPNLDIVFLGDSIIERFSGTAGMGVKGVTGHKAAFDRRFSKSAGGRMEGKAFGTAEDAVSIFFCLLSKSTSALHSRSPTVNVNEIGCKPAVAHKEWID